MMSEPTAEQFLETAQKLRIILDYGLAGALVGDNDIARCVVACETTAEGISQKTKSCNGLADKLPRKEITMRPSSENQSIDHEMAKLRSKIERLRDFARQVELNTRAGDPLVLKLNWLARQALGIHASDCAVNNAPALPVGPCDCGVEP